MNALCNHKTNDYGNNVENKYTQIETLSWLSA